MSRDIDAIMRGDIIEEIVNYGTSYVNMRRRHC